MHVHRYVLSQAGDAVVLSTRAAVVAFWTRLQTKLYSRLDAPTLTLKEPSPNSKEQSSDSPASDPTPDPNGATSVADLKQYSTN